MGCRCRAAPRRHATLAYDAFLQTSQRKAINEIMRRYALKEDGPKRARQNSALSRVTLIRGARGLYRQIHCQKYRRLRA